MQQTESTVSENEIGGGVSGPKSPPINKKSSLRRLFRRWSDHVISSDTGGKIFKKQHSLRKSFAPYYEQRESVIELLPLSKDRTSSNVNRLNKGKSSMIIERESRQSISLWMLLCIV